VIKQYVNLNPDDPAELGKGPHQILKKRAGRTVELRAKVSPARENVFVKFTFSPGANNTPPEKLSKEERAHFASGREDGALAVTDADGMAKVLLHLSLAGLDEFTVKAHVLFGENSSQEIAGPTFQVWKRLYLEKWTLEGGKPGKGRPHWAMPALAFPSIDSLLAAEWSKVGVETVFTVGPLKPQDQNSKPHDGLTTLSPSRRGFRPAILSTPSQLELVRKHDQPGPVVAMVAVDQLGDRRVEERDFKVTTGDRRLATPLLYSDPSMDEGHDWFDRATAVGFLGDPQGGLLDFLGLKGDVGGSLAWGGAAVPASCFERPIDLQRDRTGLDNRGVGFTSEWGEWLKREGIDGSRVVLRLRMGLRDGTAAGVRYQNPFSPAEVKKGLSHLSKWEQQYVLSNPNGNVLLLSSWSHHERLFSATKQFVIGAHELGHAVGLAAPDQSTYYVGRGHQGPHCHAGIGLMNSYRPDAGATKGEIANFTARLKSASCLMFGSLDGSGTTLCSECRASARRSPVRWPLPHIKA
jgi:hypothetical protein